jgi:hypothetical protein
VPVVSKAGGSVGGSVAVKIDMCLFPLNIMRLNNIIIEDIKKTGQELNLAPERFPGVEDD